MTAEIHNLRAPKKMRKPRSRKAPIMNLVELPLPDTENMTPQELLAKLSRDPRIEKVLVIFPSSDPENPFEEITHVLFANMQNSEVNWFADKAKLKTLGFDV
jgi:hypothetical protein